MAYKNLCLGANALSKQQSVGQRSTDCSYYYNLLASMGAVQESHDMCTGADIVGGKGRITHTVGDPTRHCPTHSLSIVFCAFHIRKQTAFRDWLSSCAPKEGHRFCARNHLIGTKGCFPSSRCDAVFRCPKDSIIIISIFGDVGKRHLCCLRRRRAVSTPQERYHLRAGTACVGCKECITLTGGDLVFTAQATASK